MSYHVRPPRDEDRVLTQIAVGDVRADADAAREIAARHQEAYGDVWPTAAAGSSDEEPST